MDGSWRAEARGPVVAVLPLTVPGDDAELGLLAEGLHEDICSALTRFRALRVISPHSVMAVAALAEPEIGSKLSASHLLRGRLRREGERLRLTASLVATADATQVWDERIELPLAEVSALRDEVVARVVSTLSARLEETALANARRLPAAELAVHELTLRGLSVLRQGTVEADALARELFAQALQRDPTHARAHVGISLSWFNEWSCQFWDRFEETSRKAYVHAHHALQLDDTDAMVHLVIAKVQLYRREFEQASWYVDRALTLCPNDADLLVQAALCEVYLGRADVGLRHIARAMRLNPYHPGDYFGVAAIAHCFAGDVEAAIATQQKCAASPFVDSPAYRALPLALAGRTDEARSEWSQFEVLFEQKIASRSPERTGEPLRWLLDVNPFRRQEDVDLQLRALLPLAGSSPPQRGTAEGSAASALLARTEDGWLAEFDGQRVTLPDLKGLVDIRRLLERPDQEIHCLDLAERSETTYGADDVLDDAARASIKSRIRELQQELAEAEDLNDTGRAERLAAELERLMDDLSRALGLGGKSRRLGDQGERARSAITWRIRHAIRKVEATHPTLGRHLENSVRTGSFCVYRPEVMVSWALPR